MKLTDPDAIRTNERELMDTIHAELDWEGIEKMVLEKHRFYLQDDVDFKQGDIIVYENEVAYRLDFDMRVSLSVVLNRNGECVTIQSSGAASESLSVPPVSAEPDKPGVFSGGSGIASEIAEMISDINEGGRG